MDHLIWYRIIGVWEMAYFPSLTESIQAYIMDCKGFLDNFALERIVVSPSPFIRGVEYFVMT